MQPLSICVSSSCPSPQLCVLGCGERVGFAVPQYQGYALGWEPEWVHLGLRVLAEGFLVVRYCSGGNPQVGNSLFSDQLAAIGPFWD